jgi:signal transduction histidine kinase
MISPFGLSGCLINLIIGGICIFVRYRRAGRAWLVYAAAFHFVNALIYALTMTHATGPDLAAYLHSWAGLPLIISLGISGTVLPAALFSLFGRPPSPRRLLAALFSVALLICITAAATQPFYGYLLAHGSSTLCMLACGIVLMGGPTAFYRMVGFSFIGRSVYSLGIVISASQGAPGWIFDAAVTVNMTFISLTGLGFILIELDDARARIAEADIAKTLFIANMSHELRTPLNAIIGFSEIMDGTAIPVTLERCRDYAAHILTSARHLLNIISQLLDMAAIEAQREKLSLERVILDDVIDSCLTMLRGDLSNKGIEFTLDKPDQPIVLLADITALRQILLCLLGNAIKFSPQGGALILRVDLMDATNEVRFAVTDHGPGIQPAHLNRIFDPFWQAEGTYQRAQGGVGLGLTIAKRLVDSLEGSFTVESEPGQGSTFAVTLPRHLEVSSQTTDQNLRAVVERLISKV